MELRILPTAYFVYYPSNKSFVASATRAGVRINDKVEYIRLRNNKTGKYILFKKTSTSELNYYYRPTVDNQDSPLTEEQKELLIVIQKPKFYNL